MSDLFRARSAALLALSALLAACTGTAAPTPGAATSPPLTGSPTPSATTATPPTASPTEAPATPPTLPAKSAGCDASARVDVGDRDLVLDVDGTERAALVHVPLAAKPGRPTALVVVYHGTISDPADIAWISGFSDVADEYGFVVAYPAGLGSPSTWNFGAKPGGADDLGLTSALLDRLSEDLCLDPRRIFASGFSVGGDMAMLLGCRMQERIAAVAFVGAAYGPGLGDCLPPRPISTIVFHGLLDPLLPYRGGVNPLPEFDGWPPSQDVEAWASTWAMANGCTAGPGENDPVGFAVRLAWEDCAAPMELYRLGDGGHAWPGGNGFEAFGRINRDVSASELTWAFFNGN